MAATSPKKKSWMSNGSVNERPHSGHEAPSDSSGPNDAASIACSISARASGVIAAVS